jgi:N-acetylglucosaminyldiphosphoundecaprenol N-acetyl-beta-D-mannosaminyltransferase
MTHQQLIKLKLSLGSFQDFVNNIVILGHRRQSSYVCVANVHSCIETYQDATFATLVNQADMVTPDGMPLVKALSLLYGIKQEKVSGPDLMPALLLESEKQGLKVYFYGSTDEVLDKLKDFCQSNYPKLSIAGMQSPPFRVLTEAETHRQIQRINESGANIVLVALGCPKQERWMASMKGKIKAVMVGVGGAFPMLVGVQKRAPRWMQRNSLEWLYRLAQEPRRLFKRYFITNNLFMLLIFNEKIKISLAKK